MKPTPEQAQDLVEHFGSIRETARALGYARSSIQGWLRPEAARERNARNHRENRESRLAAMRERYYGLSGYEYARTRLLNRRVKALARMRKRNEERNATSG